MRLCRPRLPLGGLLLLLLALLPPATQPRCYDDTTWEDYNGAWPLCAGRTNFFEKVCYVIIVLCVMCFVFYILFFRKVKTCRKHYTSW